MKRFSICIFLLGVLLLSGCGNNAAVGDESSLNISQSSEPMPAVDTSEEPRESPGNEVQQGTQFPINSDDGNLEAIAESGTPYTWQEITITLPAAWVDACEIIEQENGFAIFQKASYEKDGSSGYICQFYRTEEYIYYGAGETLIAYTDDGMLYYLVQPTDVACDTRDEAILNEYIGLCGGMAEVKASVEIAAPGIHLDAEEYVLPISGISALDDEMLQYLSDNELWIARNEIYARHGRQFLNGYLQRYFDRCTWYEGTTSGADFDDSVLSQVEKDNIDLLLAAEQQYDRLHPYPKRYEATETASEDLHGDGTDNIIGYNVIAQENGDAQCYVTVDGTSYLVNELVNLWTPLENVFYITDVREDDGVLEIALLDNGPSDDPVTYFFRLEETLSYIGQVSGFPFAEENSGVNGFDGYGGISGQVRMDLIETVYLKGYWRYDMEKEWIVYQDVGWNAILPTAGHTLYVDLPVCYEMDEASESTIIPAHEEVFFLGSDMYEWILVKGKDVGLGYMRVEDGVIAELNMPASEVFSGLNFFD